MEVTAPGDRFVDASDDLIADSIEGSKPPNTKKNTDWTVRAYGDFIAHFLKKHNTAVPNLLDATPAELDTWLSRFVYAIKQQNGKDYSANSIYYLACGIGRYLTDKGKEFNILDPTDHRFKRFRDTLDTKMKMLTAAGHGVTQRMAKSFSREEEATLWRKNVFGDHSAQALLHTMFFYNSKLFALRGRDEHRSLTTAHIVVWEEPTGILIKFTETQSKTYKGGLKDRKKQPKEVTHFSRTESEPNIGYYYKTYMDTIHSEDVGPFYRKPLPNLGNLLRYGKQPVGVNKLQSYMKDIASLGGLGDGFTNHSGKTTCATQLFNANLDEQLIMERTGHSSTAVRRYKRTSREQQEMVSQLLDPPQRAIHVEETSPHTESTPTAPFDQETVSQLINPSQTEAPALETPPDQYRTPVIRPGTFIPVICAKNKQRRVHASKVRTPSPGSDSNSSQELFAGPSQIKRKRKSTVEKSNSNESMEAQNMPDLIQLNDSEEDYTTYILDDGDTNDDKTSIASLRAPEGSSAKGGGMVLTNIMSSQSQHFKTDQQTVTIAEPQPQHVAVNNPPTEDVRKTIQNLISGGNLTGCTINFNF